MHLFTITHLFQASDLIKNVEHNSQSHLRNLQNSFIILAFKASFCWEIIVIIMFKQKRNIYIFRNATPSHPGRER